MFLASSLDGPLFFFLFCNVLHTFHPLQSLLQLVGVLHNFNKMKIFLTHAKCSGFIYIYFYGCFKNRISVLCFNDKIILFSLALVCIKCQLTMITDKSIMACITLKHLFPCFSLACLYKNWMISTSFRTVFKMIIIHLLVYFN